LFRFTRGTRSWFYSSSDRTELHNGDTYEPAPISYGSIKQGSERAKLKVKIELPATLPVAANWRPYPPSDAVVLTIFNRHVGETDALVEWMGRVVGPEFDGPLLELTGEPSTTSNRRKGNVRTWQRGCGLVLYGAGNGMCNVDKAAHAVAASLTAVTGLSLTAAAFGALPAGRLAGGFVEWERADGLVEFRTIKGHVGSTVTLDYGGLDLAPGLAVTAYPGCAHNWADCGYYSNQPNYGGDLWMPIKGPYDGNPVW
jgi:hypothetical protein